MTTTHDIPDDIREALQIREDLDRISGRCDGRILSDCHNSSSISLVLLMACTYGSLMSGIAGFFPLQWDLILVSFLLFQGALVLGYRWALVRRRCTVPALFRILSVLYVTGIGTLSVIAYRLSDASRTVHSFTLGSTRLGLGTAQFAYSDVQRVTLLKMDDVASQRLGWVAPFCIQIDVYGERTPHTVLMWHDQRTTEWFVAQIQVRMAAAQSGTIPEDLTRLTKQAGQTTLSDACPRQTLSNPSRRITKIR